MKKVIMGLSLCLLMGLTACSNGGKKNTTDETTTSSSISKEQSEKYEAAIDDGKQAIVDKEISKAVASFQLALEYKTDDREANQLISQAELYQEALSLTEDKEYAQALKKLTKLKETRGGSTALKQYGTNLTDKISKEVKAEREETKKRKATEESKQAEKEKNSTEESKEAEKKEETDPSKEAAPAANSLWNAQKSSALGAFMISWGQTMGQAYIEYSPSSELDYYGVKFPSTFAAGNIAVNGAPASVQWSTDGSASNVYNVVAIYSDVHTTSAMERHLYLFAIYNGQPVALVTMQNQGNNENLIYFTPTQNADLSNGFAQIIGG
ncbi:DUF4767 domain-containing protein [Enterococcus sp. LJL128]